MAKQFNKCSEISKCGWKFYFELPPFPKVSLWTPSKASEDPLVKMETEVERTGMKTLTLSSIISWEFHEPKAVAAKEETTIGSPGRQPRECDA